MNGRCDCAGFGVVGEVFLEKDRTVTTQGLLAIEFPILHFAILFRLAAMGRQGWIAVIIPLRGYAAYLKWGMPN